jgi:hypothetical protein
VLAADDEDEDDKTFEEKVIEGIMRGLGGTNMENRGIDYRERSPLVVPPKIDLPPPGQRAAEPRRRTGQRTPTSSAARPAIEARKKANKDPREASRVLTPSELSRARPSRPPRTHRRSGAAGHTSTTRSSAPSQLGYTGGFSGLFGGNKAGGLRRSRASRPRTR